MPVEQKQAPILEMRRISKSFPGVKALSEVSLTLRAGEIHALMGENGAGKSTLMKILSGAYTADPGSRILIDGCEVTINGPLSARALGIAVIYQEFSLSANLTVAENIYLGRELRRFGVVDRRAMAKGCEPILRRLGASFGPEALVSDLSIAERQLVEIARALHAKARILVMDEPTTPLSSRETGQLFSMIRELREDGMAIVYISHRMEEIYELADQVSVLRDGTYVGTLDRSVLSAETLVKMMVGRDLSGFYKKTHDVYQRGECVLSVRGLSDGRRVRNCSFDLHAGEVLGIAGLVGAGRTELARLLFGAERRRSGSIRLRGADINMRTPLDAIRAGLAYLTEDRKAQGLFLDMSVNENINVCTYSREARAGVLSLSKARLRSRAAIRTLGIRVHSPDVNVGSLSGGNQQKVLLSRLIELSPHVLILDEPTRGVDIGAKSEIYRIIAKLAQEGMAVVVISSELPEIIGTADRVLVMREGELVGELGGDTGQPITQEAVIALATSGDRASLSAAA